MMKTHNKRIHPTQFFHGQRETYKKEILDFFLNKQTEYIFGAV